MGAAFLSGAFRLPPVTKSPESVAKLSTFWTFSSLAGTKADHDCVAVPDIMDKVVEVQQAVKNNAGEVQVGRRVGRD